MRLDARLLREATAARRRTYLRRESGLMLPALLLNLVAVGWLGSFLGDHVGEPRFAIPAAVLLGAAVFVVATSLRQLVLWWRIDHDAPVVAHQRQLERIKLERVRVTKLLLLASPLLWTPLIIVSLEALFDADAYRLLGVAFLAANLLFGVAAIPVLLFLARRYGERLVGRPLLRRLADDVAGRNLDAALDYLRSLAAFEEEPPPTDR